MLAQMRYEQQRLATKNHHVPGWQEAGQSMVATATVETLYSRTAKVKTVFQNTLREPMESMLAVRVSQNEHEGTPPLGSFFALPLGL